MTNRIAEAVLVVGIVATSLVAFPSLVKAQEQPCKTISDMEVEIEATGGLIAGAATYQGAQTDTLLVVETADMILLYGFKDGCYIGAMAVEAALPATPA
jgi:hypothetical protein